MEGSERTKKRGRKEVGEKERMGRREVRWERDERKVE